MKCKERNSELMVLGASATCPASVNLGLPDSYRKQDIARDSSKRR